MIMNSTLREAMHRADHVDQIDLEQVEAAITGEIVEDKPEDRHAMEIIHRAADRIEKIDEESRAKALAEEQRQRDLDAAMADAVEVVARQRSRLGRRVCSSHDGSTVRKLFDLLKNMNGDIESGFGV